MRCIGLSQRICISEHNEKRDCLAHDWTRFLATVGIRWVALPNNETGALRIAEGLNLCGLVLTGGDDIGVFPERDATEFALLHWSKRQYKPVVGVCRGFQVMYTWLGGTLQAVQREQHVATRHTISFSSGDKRMVNSYHTLAPAPVYEQGFPLRPLAFCEEDESIEAAKCDLFFGMMWHPERDPIIDERDIHTFRQYFSEACYD